jgi:hypothetical protein
VWISLPTGSLFPLSGTLSNLAGTLSMGKSIPENVKISAGEIGKTNYGAHEYKTRYSI